MERRRRGMILRSEKVLFRNISSSESEHGGSFRSASSLPSRTSSRVSLLEEELADLNREQAEVDRQQEERNQRREELLNELERRSSDCGCMYTVRSAPVQGTSNRVVGWPTRSEHPRDEAPSGRKSWAFGPKRGAATEVGIDTPPIEAPPIVQVNDPIMVPKEPQAARPIMPKQVSKLSSHPRYGRTNSDPYDALRYLVARQSEAKELPRFSGDPREFPNFISQYKRTMRLCGYSDEENLNRLQKCLTGQARRAVYALLALPESVGKIIEILERRFGRPELVIGELGRQLRELPGIKENDYEGLICFSSEIQNYVISVEVLGALDYLIEPSMLKTLVSKLPGSVRVQWGEYMLGMSTDVTRVNEFSAWLERKAEAMSLIANHFPDAIEGVVTTMATIQDKSRSCRFCEGDPHALAKCPKWLKASLNARWSWAAKGKLCFRCLLPNHSAPKCKSNLECGVCQGYHHDTLHKEKESASQQQGKAQSQAHVEVTHEETNPASEAQQWKALLRIVPVKLYGPKGTVESHALLDEGSSITMVEQTVADKLGILGPIKPLSLAWTGQMGRVEEESQAITLDISGVHEQARKFKLFNVRTVKCLGLRAQTVDVRALAKKWPFILKGAVASPKEAKAEIIIGQDNWPLLASRKTFYGPWKGPVVTQTWLGWVLHGNVPQPVRREEQPHRQLSHWEDIVTEEELLDKWVKRELLEPEPSGKERKLMSIEEKKARELFDNTTKRVGSRWETGLLWKLPGKLPESFNMAKKRLQSLEKRMDRDPYFAERYCAKMQENFDKQYARVVTPEEMERDWPKVWYLPHLGIVNPNKPNKLRICFDAAAKSKGFCLNDFLYKGPDLLESIPGLWIRFRQYPVALTGDIKEMYPQVKIRPEDQHAQRFLWRGLERKEPPQICVMESMLFGAICSPFAAQEVKNRNALQYESEAPRAVNAIIHKHYMDDYVDSVATEVEAIKLLEKVGEIHASGGFILCSIASNSKAVMDSVPKELGLPALKDALGSPAVVRILGIPWDVTNDQVYFAPLWQKLKKERWKEGERPTKRRLLRMVMLVFDPLGFLLNVSIQAKMLLQELWSIKMHWDDQVPVEHMKKWDVWFDRMEEVMTKVKIDRCYLGRAGKYDTTQLHVFCDASEKAYATIAYLRFQGGHQVGVKFVAARGRVAPMKHLSIPRLELQGAVLAVKLHSFLRQELEFPIGATYFWTDSKVVLYWINSESRRFQPFVANRISEIAETTSPQQWRWVKSADNPADGATKWRPENLDPWSVWLSGPAFLLKDEGGWPTESMEEVGSIDLELRENPILVTNGVELNVPLAIPEVGRFSKWLRLIRVTAWGLRYVDCLRKRTRMVNKPALKLGGRRPALLRPEEMEAAELIWCRRMQWDSFKGELIDLKQHGEVKDNSRIVQLNPMLGDGDLMCISGRISKASADSLVRHPIIADPQHRYTKLLIQSYHERMLHQGQETVLNELRQRYWILSARQAVRTITRACRECRLRKSPRAQVQMGELPRERMADHVRPFTNVGMDYFGPLCTRVGRRTEKRYGVLFTCLTTRAIHLEMAFDLTTSGTIMAIRRFCARRGEPRKIFSDNGTNLRGADNELKKALMEWKQGQFHEDLGIHGIKWIFNPPSAPHMGGCWERLIRTVKASLEVLLKNRTLTDEILLTFLAEAEAVVNSRPLTHVSLDPKDEEALTPNHFLIGTSGIAPVLPPIPEEVCLKRSWRTAQQLADQFWRRWIKEYRPTLLKRAKWHKSKREVHLGDVVLIMDANERRGHWPKGLVTAVYPGSDGKIRVVDVKTGMGTLRRPVVKLCPLPTKEED